MAESITAGAVSLDLVIKDTLDKQLAGIKNRVESVFNKSAELAQSSLSKTAQSAAETTSQTVKEVESANNGIAKAVAECMQRIEDQQKRVVESAAQAASSVKPQEIRLNINTDYDPSVVEAQVNEITKGIEDKLNGVKEKSKEVFEDYQIPETQIERLRAQLDIIDEKMRELQDTHRQLQEAYANTGDKDTSSKIIKEITSVEEKLISLADKADKTREKIDAALNDDGDPQVEESIKKVERSANKASSSIRNRFGGAFRSVKNISQKAFGSVKEKIKSVGDSANAVTKPVESLFKRIRNGARRIFIMAGILSVLKSMRSALSDAASSNKQFSDSLESIKFNLAVAFQPILTAVMPMLNTLMSGIAGVTEKIAAFTSALFGKTYQQSAQAVAKSKQAAAAAKNAGKEAKAASKYLADFDEMRVHQDSSDSSSGAESSETDYSKYTGKDVKLSDWAEKFKESIKSGDWAGAGKLLAEKINSVFERIKWGKVREKLTNGARKAAEGINGFADNLNWKGIGGNIGEGLTSAFSAAYTFLKTTKWKSIGAGFANFLNGIITKTDLSLIGKTIGARLNALIGLAFGFVTTFNFAAAGLGLADIINGWFNEVNWEQLGDTLGGAIQGVIEFGFNFAENIKFVSAAEKIVTAFNRTLDKVDFGKLGKTVSDAFKGVWDFIGTAVEKVDWGNVGKKIGDFISNIDWLGILRSVFKVIGGILKATPKLLLGLVESLDFEGAAGLFGVLFAPKIAKKLLSKFVGDSGVVGTLKSVGSTIIDKIGIGIKSVLGKLKEIGSAIAGKLKSATTSGAESIGSLFGSKFAKGLGTAGAVVGAAVVGWQIGSKIYEAAKPAIDKITDALQDAFNADRYVKGIEDEVDARSKKTLQKYKNLGYKNLTLDDVKNESQAFRKAKNEVLAKNNQQSAASHIPTTAERIAQAQKQSDYDKNHRLYTPNSFMPSNIPKLATGGIVKAPTLALVGDNADARSNPEVVAPLSELQSIMGAGGDIARYLQQIIALIESLGFDIHTDIDGQTLFRTVVKHNASYKARTGASAF